MKKLTTRHLVGEALKARHDTALDAVYNEAREVIADHCPELMAQYSDGIITRAELVIKAISQLTQV